MRARLIAVLTAIACACRAAPPPEGPAERAAVQRITEPDAGASPEPGAADAGVVDEALPFAEYRATFLRELMRLTKTREAAVPEADAIRTADGPLPRSIEVLKRIGQAESFVVTTAGFGRIAHGARKRAHVELLAYVERYGPKVGQVLEALGGEMHARGATGPAWKEYDTVALPSAEHGLQHFDLRPAGEIDVSPELRVVLLKVMPMSPDEYERAQNNPAGEWDDPNAAARASARWRRLVER